MPIIIDLREDIKEYIKKHGLAKKWDKAKNFSKMIHHILHSIPNCWNPSIASYIPSELI